MTKSKPPKIGREEFISNPSTSHPYDGFPVAFGKTILVLAFGRHSFDSTLKFVVNKILLDAGADRFLIVVSDDALGEEVKGLMDFEESGGYIVGKISKGEDHFVTGGAVN